MNEFIYLDYCATTPVHPAVKKMMLETLDRYYGNPSSMHQAGIEAKKLLDRARSSVATRLGCQPEEVVFTSGATEADNLAIFGVMRQYEPGNAHLITSAIEHHAVLHAAHQLRREGYSVTVLPVDSDGLVDPDDVNNALGVNTKLVSIMQVNNEVGSIQPIAEIGKFITEKEVLFHTDAVQGIGYLDADVRSLKIDLLSLSAHKVYGPKGAGALFFRNKTNIQPMIHGGPQEMGLRPGTENIPGIVGLGEAIRLTANNQNEEFKRLSELRTWFIGKIKAIIPGVVVNGSNRVAPHILSISFPDAIAEMMQFHLHSQGVAVSLGSACTSKDIEPSHVLQAMGLPFAQIEGTLRLSFGYPTTKTELEKVVELLPDIWRRSKSS